MHPTNTQAASRTRETLRRFSPSTDGRQTQPPAPLLYPVVWFAALALLLYFPVHTVLNRILWASPVG